MEVWKDIEGFEGEYKVSNLGSVRSVDRFIDTTRGKRRLEGRLIKPYKTPYGYLVVKLKEKNMMVHRIVAETFIDNPYGLPQVNHIDGDKTNNNYTNLEWITNRENVIHAYKTGLRKVKKYPKEEMIDLYINKKLPLSKIAEIKKCSPSTIRKVLVEYGIHIRDCSESKFKFNITKEYLKNELKKKSQSKISREIGCSLETIRVYREKYNLDLEGNER